MASPSCSRDVSSTPWLRRFPAAEIVYRHRPIPAEYGHVGTGFIGMLFGGMAFTVKELLCRSSKDNKLTQLMVFIALGGGVFFGASVYGEGLNFERYANLTVKLLDGSPHEILTGQQLWDMLCFAENPVKMDLIQNMHPAQANLVKPFVQNQYLRSVLDAKAGSDTTTAEELGARIMQEETVLSDIFNRVINSQDIDDSLTSSKAPFETISPNVFSLYASNKISAQNYVKIAQYARKHNIVQLVGYCNQFYTSYKDEILRVQLLGNFGAPSSL